MPSRSQFDAIQFPVIDLQVNGVTVPDEAEGQKVIDFSSPDLNLGLLERACEFMSRKGVRRFLFTTVTKSPELLEHVLDVAAQAMATPWGKRSIVGIHTEGPFLSPEPGWIGAHEAEFCIAPSTERFDQLNRAARGGIALVTLDPSQEGANELIRHLSELKIVSAVGHSTASAEQLRRAQFSGLKLCTHVGNACPEMIQRHVTTLLWQAACSELFGSYVIDGHHLPEDFARCSIELRGLERSLLVSDMSPLAGAKDGEYTWLSNDVKVADGRVAVLESGHNAGAWKMLIDNMNQALEWGYTYPEVGRMACENPWHLLGDWLKSRELDFDDYGYLPDETPLVFDGNSYKVSA